MNRVILFTFALFISAISGAVYSAPESASARADYTLNLNSMAALVMQHYRTILQNKLKNKKPYHHNVSNIQITNTQLSSSTINKNQQFIATISVKHDNAGTLQTESRQETFSFNNDHSNLKLLDIKSHFEAPLKSDINKKYNAEYYLHREIAYAWLAYLDGSKTHKNKFNNIHYSVVIGSNKWSDTAEQALQKRHPFLAKGGHLLHSVEAHPFKHNSPQRTIDLIIEWKGNNQNDTPVFAKIKQTIQYQRFNDGNWTIIDVKEKHLLPTDMPWQGLLC